jgi:peroxiredoxin Q/BCP
MLTIGIKAPDFKLRLDSGEIFRLRDLQGKNNVVITFFPHDFDKAESHETYAFLRQLQKVQAFGAYVITISPKNLEKLREFLELYNFTIPIASDSTLEVCRNYRAVWLKGLALRKITYVIDKKGIIRGHVNHQFLSDKSWEQVIRLLRGLNAEKD